MSLPPLPCFWLFQTWSSVFPLFVCLFLRVKLRMKLWMASKPTPLETFSSSSGVFFVYWGVSFS